MLAEGEVWIYGDGFWHVMTPTDQQRLLADIQFGFDEIGEPGKASALALCWKRINEHHGLLRMDVPWA